MKIALFDFDGTVTTKDSLAEFVQYAVGKPSYYFGLMLLSPIIIAYKLKFLPNHIAKEKLISHFFKGWGAENFQNIARQFSLDQIDKITRPAAIQKINWHKQHGHKVVIVSASMMCWLEVWCNKNHIDLISTQLEIKDNKLTGKFATKNCNGIEKANRVKAIYDLSQYDRIYAYGDSQGDMELLGLANERFYKPFRT